MSIFDLISHSSFQVERASLFLFLDFSIPGQKKSERLSDFCPDLQSLFGLTSALQFMKQVKFFNF